MIRRAGLRAMSEKRLKSGVRTRAGSTFALGVVPSTAERIAAMQAMQASGPVKWSSLPERTTKLKARNAERCAKRDAAYRAGLVLSRKAPGYRDAHARSGGQCEVLVKHDGSVASAFSCDDERLVAPILGGGAVRCDWRERGRQKLQGHHRTYIRFPSNELPEDYAFVCRTHHEMIEAAKPTHRPLRFA
ncbi:MAG: hypothetical protein ACHQWU_16805 [Gemmatimonadales bacterium]